jgi:3(or 17)beta-hydroxysteroid dehydrogenase
VNRLKGKVAIVTGGASGIGAGTVRLFAAEGAKVVLADIDEPLGTAVVDEIRESGGEATFMVLNVTSEDDWRRVVAETVELYGKLNVLVNNAGVSIGRSVEDTTLEDWDFVMGVNATGVFLGIKHAIEAMKRNGEPCSIVNRSSIDGQIAEPGLFAYCASKGAVTLMSKAAALDATVKGYAIRVNSVHPASVHTSLTDKEAANLGLSPDAYVKKLAALLPIGFLGHPIDVAYLDLFLASDESRWITGSEFNADGGYTAGRL